MNRKSKYTKELLSPIIKRNQTWAAVLRELGLVAAGGNYKHVRERARNLGLSWDHFRGQSWAKGLTKETDKRIAKQAARQRLANEDVFIANSLYSTSKLTPRLLELGWEYKCAICGISEWQEKALVLPLDHINGISTDHRFENLRFLCPNCHSQTPTFAGRNIKYRKRKNTCIDCGVEISNPSTRCKGCAVLHHRETKIDWPEMDDLLAMLEESSCLAVGKKLGVSDSAIRHHISSRVRQQERQQKLK